MSSRCRRAGVVLLPVLVFPIVSFLQVKMQDMPGCVTVPETTAVPQKGAWVRMRGGVYKGDLAKVGKHTVLSRRGCDG